VTVLATIVETDKLLQTVAAALVASVGVTLAFSLLIVGAARFADQRREGTLIGAAAFAILAAIGLAGCVLALVVGLTVMLQK